MLEEIGHYVDAQINEIDTVGDEGELFSYLVRGINLTDAQLNIIRQEYDHQIIVVDDQEIAIETGIGQLITTPITTSTTPISIIGTGTQGTDLNIGVAIAFGGSISSTGTGAATITIIGNGATDASGVGNYGIILQGDTSTITSVDGAIDLTGKGGSGTDFNVGVILLIESKIDSTGTASINITGNGSLLTAGVGNDGVRIEGNSSVNSISGNITITGTAGTGSQQNQGVLLVSNGLITSETGNITVNGTGGSTGISNYGVWLTSGGSITSTGTEANASQINIIGNGSTTATGNIDNDGVRIDGTNSKVSSVAGAISITGTAGNGTNGNRGVVVFDNGIVTSETGNITVHGTGNGTGSENYGVYIINGGKISSTGSSTIIINGQGSLTEANGNGNDGVRVEGENSVISSIDSLINIQGTGGNGNNFNRGVWLEQKGQITTETGTITINGTAQS
ncbi:beta strand repeat-containing protein, partial [Geminocystis sp. CENA526]|uniref:beta strand repeat-containing protein n=1 Tax=Geminocystis sp. CENA526 TaxID=1355871 RepID=UPI003D6DC798